MARHANVQWKLPEGESDGHGTWTHDWDSVHAALLMDIRDELRTLNRLLACANFLSIPPTLHRIARNTTKRTKRKPT